MKKYIVGILCAVAIITTAHAAVKCLALDENTKCSVVSNNGVEWFVKCGDITIRGESACTETLDETRDEIAERLQKNHGENCYCRVVYPVVTKWWYRWDNYFDDWQMCRDGCAGRCADIAVQHKYKYDDMHNPISESGVVWYMSNYALQY